MLVVELLVFKDRITSTPQGCLILARSLSTITREVVHQHRSLPFATLCLNDGHIHVADAGERIIPTHLRGLLVREALSLPKGTLCLNMVHGRMDHRLPA